MTFGIFNNGDQTEEEDRTQHGKRQAKAQAKLIAVAVSHALQPQGNPKGARRFNHQSGGETKGECFKCKSPGRWAHEYQEKLPGLAQSANRPVTGDGTALGPQGEWGLLLLRWPCWMTEAAQGFSRLPLPRPHKMSISLEPLVAGKVKFLN